MSRSSKRSWRIALLFGALAFALVAYGLPRISSASHGDIGSGTCIRAQRHTIATGISPTGKSWFVKAGIRNDGGCSAWLFKVEFAPAGRTAGSWSGAWQIPAGGHLGKTFLIGAADEALDNERTFSGVVGARVREVELTTSTGSHIKVRPRLPAKSLLRRFVWLHGLRYFVRYYPVGSHVALARLRDRYGKTIYVAHGEEGMFEAAG